MSFRPKPISRLRLLSAGTGALLWSLGCGANAAGSPADATVVGTLVTENRSLAIIEFEPGIQRLMSSGDRLNECTIGSIAHDHVTIECDADTRHMLLSTPKWPSRIQTAANGLNRNARLFSIPRLWFDDLISNRQRLAGEISLEPAVAGGYVYGYRVTALKKDGGLSRLGIEPGDVITHVNDASVSDAGTFIQTVDALAGQTAFSLQVERDGESLQVSYVLIES